MTTAELSIGTQGPVMHQALTMALAILVERIQGLPKEDKCDLFELCKEVSHAKSEDETNSIVIAMREILEQQPGTIKKLDQPNPADESPSKGAGGLHGWVRFIGDRIKKLREEKGMTQDDLAKASGLTQSHISRIEKHKHSPAHFTIEKIAGALGVSPSDLDPSA